MIQQEEYRDSILISKGTYLLDSFFSENHEQLVDSNADILDTILVTKCINAYRDGTWEYYTGEVVRKEKWHKGKL